MAARRACRWLEASEARCKVSAAGRLSRRDYAIQEQTGRDDMTSIRMLAAALLASGCAGVTVSSNTAPGANLQKYRTFAWLTPPAEQPVTLADQEVKSSLA